jgi:putative heme-binding domain-containing protein
MRHPLRFLALFILLTSVVGRARAQAPPPFELRDGDRVVLLGDTLIEREQHYGYLELALTTRFPERNVTFRNIGWSADTPAGVSRFGLSLLQAGLEPPDEGWKQLREQLRQLRPTVVVLGYGMASSFAGEAGLPRFVADMERLLDSIREQAAGAPVRVVILSPIAHQHAPVPLPDPAAHNRALASYAEALRQLAARRWAAYVPLFDGFKDRPAEPPLTDNGIHLNAAGYRRAAELLETGLGWPPGPWRDSPRTERLRQAIIQKNQLFFYRSRPENMAYIFGFRKREQGQNAVEIPRFDPLIEAEEKIIARLRSLKPVELTPEPPLRMHSAVAKFAPQPRPSFQVADGFEVTLWAENPLLAKPTQMNFDPQGRLWVASSEVYPQIEPGQTANDKIIILEDTTGAGRADKSTVFADGLLIPTGLEPGDGGVYVAQSTELLHLRDTDGDGKADVRRVVLSGFGTEDAHHNLHTLRWGFDGRLYMNQSVYTRTDTETPDGVVRLKGGGVFRLDPRSLRMGVLFRGWWNSWGHQFDPFGQSFLTDGAGGDGVSWGVPGAMYSATPGARRLLGSVSPGSYPKFCSLEIIHSRHFPDDWQGDFVTCDFRANRVVRFRVEEDGAGYVARELPDLLRSTEVSFRPIDVKLGPDGALYVADWSNPIINHGEVDFRDPRRDREHGRIWRVTAKGRPLNPRPKLTTAGNAELFEKLLSPNGYDRAQARRVLSERGPAVLTDLEKWLALQTTDEARLQALWLHQAFGSIDADLLRRVLQAGDGRVRAAAVRALGEWAERLPDAPTLLAGLIADGHPRVRLEAVRALAHIPTAAAAELALRVLDKPMDRFLDYALWLAVNDLADPWLAGLESGAVASEGGGRKLEFALGAVEPAKAARVLGRLLDRHPLARDGRGPWIELIGRAGGPAELRRLFDTVVQDGFDEPATLRALSALFEATRIRWQRPAGDLQSLGRLLDYPSEPVRAAAVRLAGRWGLAGASQLVLRLATDKAAPATLRQAALEALCDLPDPAAVAGLRRTATDAAEPVALRRQAVLSLVARSPVEPLRPLRDLLAEKGPAREVEAFWRAILGLAGVSPRLAVTLRDQPIPATAAAVGLRVARENAGRNQDLILTLSRQAGSTAPRTYTASDVERMAALVKLNGDARRGEMVYRRPELRCVACHAIGGAGGKVGPDLTSVGASAPLDYLIESIYLPDKAIKEGFHSVQLNTTDGRVYTGILVRETGQEVVLRDANGQETAVPRDKIAERSNGGSLMPAGLVDHLFEREQRDLFRFLSELGRPGPFDAARNRSARLWRVVAPDPADAKAVEQAHCGDGALVVWTPLTTTVAGALLRSELAALASDGRPIRRAVYAATRFGVPRDGRVTLAFTGGAPPELWVDGRVVAAAKELSLELGKGAHTLVIRLDPAVMPERLLLRSDDVTFGTE